MNYREEYEELLKSGMFWEFFPEYTGDWKKDGDNFTDFKLQTVGGKTIVVWFSCGAASAVAAKKTIELYGEHNTIKIVNNPIKEEDSDNMRFLYDVQKWLGIEIELCINPKYPLFSIEDAFDRHTYMSGIYGAVCTSVLKKDARKHWESINEFDYMVMGFTSDESDRFSRFKRTERNNIINILGDLNLSKNDCFRILIEEGLRLPKMYEKLYPNANCPGCVKATSSTYWNHVRKVDPLVFASRAEQSRRLGCRLVRYKGKRLFLEELPEDAKGRPMKSFKMPECGIFCEEKI